MSEITRLSNAKGMKITRKQFITFSAAIILFIVVAILSVVRIIELKRTQRQAANYNPFTETINYNPAVQGGAITFTPNGGEYNKPVKVRLDFEPLKSSRGDDIEADIYYTNNGAEPTKNSMLYSPGQVINIIGEEELTIKARLISRIGKYMGPVYSQSYAIKAGGIVQTPPVTKTSQVTGTARTTREPESQTVVPVSPSVITDIGALDTSTQEDIDQKTRRILIKASGIENVTGSTIKIQISISQIGTAKLLAITGFEVEPKEKMAVIRSLLEKRIQEVKFSPPLLNGNAVDANIRVEFNNFGLYDGNLIIER
jgi:hypothetical protein